MKRMRLKRIFAGLMCGVMLILNTGASNVVYAASVQETEEIPKTTVNRNKKVEVGDYLELGTYYGEPILWRCVAIDENGPLMLSDKVLCLKAFDAKGGSSLHYVDDPVFSDIRKQYGSNCWSDSNLREWLNSDDESVAWTHDKPSAGNVYGRYNAYDQEAGFLSSFSLEELGSIKKVTQKVYTNRAEFTRNMTDGGTFEYNIGYGSVPSRDFNLSNAYYQNVTDRIFLPNIIQLKALCDNLGEDYLKAYPTQQAVDNSNFSHEEFKASLPCTYWINHSGTEGYSYEHVKIINLHGIVAYSDIWNDDHGGAYLGNVGVRPAFYLDEDYYLSGLSSIISSLSPEPGYQYCDISGIRAKIEFSKTVIKKGENFCAYLMEYNSDSKEPVETITQDDCKLSIGGLILNFKNSLPANTKYYISLDYGAVTFQDGTVFPGISKEDKDTWSFRTVPIEYPLLDNWGGEIPLAYFMKFYPPIIAYIFHEWLDRGDGGGICYGMAYTVAAWENEYPGISLFRTEEESIRNVKWETRGNSKYTFLQYTLLAHIAQDFFELRMEQFFNKNKYKKLYDAIKEFQDGTGKPVILSVSSKESSGHAVVPLGIIEDTESQTTIIAYDCNEKKEDKFDGNGKFLTKIYLMKENNKYVNWKMSGYKGNYNGDDGDFRFLVVDEGIDEAILNPKRMEKYDLIVSDTAIDESFNSIDAYIPIRSKGDNLESNVSQYLYWTEKTSVSRSSMADTKLSRIGITDGYKEVSANAPLNSDVYLDLDANSANVKFEELSNYEITYSSALSDESIQMIEIEGKTSKELSTKQTDEGILLTADNLEGTTVSLKNGDNIISKKRFSSSDDSVLIKVNDDDVFVYEDSSDDGIYDKNIGDKLPNTSAGDDTGFHVAVFLSLAALTLCMFGLKRKYMKK